MPVPWSKAVFSFVWQADLSAENSFFFFINLLTLIFRSYFRIARCILRPIYLLPAFVCASCKATNCLFLTEGMQPHLHVTNRHHVQKTLSVKGNDSSVLLADEVRPATGIPMIRSKSVPALHEPWPIRPHLTLPPGHVQRTFAQSAPNLTAKGLEQLGRHHNKRMRQKLRRAAFFRFLHQGAVENDSSDDNSVDSFTEQYSGSAVNTAAQTTTRPDRFLSQLALEKEIITIRLCVYRNSKHAWDIAEVSFDRYKSNDRELWAEIRRVYRDELGGRRKSRFTFKKLRHILPVQYTENDVPVRTAQLEFFAAHLFMHAYHSTSRLKTDHRWIDWFVSLTRGSSAGSSPISLRSASPPPLELRQTSSSGRKAVRFSTPIPETDRGPLAPRSDTILTFDRGDGAFDDVCDPANVHCISRHHNHMQLPSRALGPPFSFDPEKFGHDNGSGIIRNYVCAPDVPGGPKYGLEFKEGLDAWKLMMGAVFVAAAHGIACGVWVQYSGDVQQVFAVMDFCLSSVAAVLASVTLYYQVVGSPV